MSDVEHHLKKGFDGTCKELKPLITSCKSADVNNTWWIFTQLGPDVVVNIPKSCKTNNIPIFNASDFTIIQFINHTYFTGIYAKLGNVPYENSCALAMIWQIISHERVSTPFNEKIQQNHHAFLDQIKPCLMLNKSKSSKHLISS